MTGRGGYKEREPGSLKEAVSQLIYACGGLDECVHILDRRVGRSQLARYADDSDENCHVNMPVDVVAKLETACGDLLVTRHLAHQGGALIVPLPGGPEEPYMRQLCRVGKNMGDFFREADRALEDGVMTPREAGRVKRETMKIATALGVLMGRLNRVIASRKDDR